MRKRIIAVLLAAVLCFLWPAPGVKAIADEELSAPSAILMEADTGSILYEKASHEVRPCASITKVMTLLLTMEAIDSGKIALTDEVAASAHAASMGGSDIWLKEGEVMSVDDLIKATVVMSANDAAVVLAEHVAGTEDEFVGMMNARAKELGMADTVFKNCNGLDEEGHLTSAHDVAVMSRELIRHEKIFDYTTIWIDEVRGGQTQLVNTNKLIKTYPGITGLKTGTTSAAGSCISATAERGGLKLIAVVLGCPSTKDRFADAAALLDYGFAGWTVTEPETPELVPVPVKNGMQTEVEIEAEAALPMLVKKGSESEVTCEVSISELLEAPVEMGQEAGVLTYTLDGEVLQIRKVLTKAAVEKITLPSALTVLLEELLRF